MTGPRPNQGSVELPVDAGARGGRPIDASRIRVSPEEILSSSVQDRIGINLNYLRDADRRRRDLAGALAEMGARRLRYPGGEKSDWISWAEEGSDGLVPHPLGYYEMASLGHEVLGFDEFVALARGVGAEPHVVVAYDSEARTGVSKEEYLKGALRLLRYANVRNRYGIKYWEIGNENWNNGTGSPEEVARIVAEFSRAMKGIDPTIKIGASGNGEDWWRGFLPEAVPDLDFLTVSVYPCMGWGGYDYYPAHRSVPLVDQVRQAEDSIRKYAGASAGRLEIVVAELNSMDFSAAPWPPANDLGHALVTFDIVGQALLSPRVAYAMIWNTRWMDTEPSTLWYSLGVDNELKPTGLALSMWGRFASGSLVATSSDEPLVAYCARNPADGKLCLFAINKSRKVRSAEISIDGGAYVPESAFVLDGSGPGDVSPELRPASRPAEGAEGKLSLDLPPVSITVLSLALRSSSIDP